MRNKVLYPRLRGDDELISASLENFSQGFALRKLTGEIENFQPKGVAC